MLPLLTRQKSPDDQSDPGKRSSLRQARRSRRATIRAKLACALTRAPVLALVA
ncbi:MAG: hypothetical protein ABSC51_12015 [Gaiellaceae bacterium]|jgi:hypothetical protein